MSSLGSPNPLLIGGAKDYEIERSLRFNAGDSPVLTYTPSSSGDQQKMTWSFWWKRASIGSAYEYMITAFNGTNTDRIAVTDDNQLMVELKDGNATEAEFHSKRIFRDPSAWYHIVVAFDTTQATASDRIKAYVNNERITEWDTNNDISQNYSCSGFNTASKAQDIGAYSGSGGSHSGHCNNYMTEIHFIDGQQLTPSDFGETHEKTGQWIPKKYGGTYGSEGYYLNFSDNSNTTATTLGKDSSGNGNNWTPNNFSVTAGVGNDSLEDSPTNNWCTWNPLVKSSNAFSEVNLKVTCSSSTPAKIVGTIGVTSGKWYFEEKLTTLTNIAVGVTSNSVPTDYLGIGDSIAFWPTAASGFTVFRNASNINSDVSGGSGTGTNWAIDDILGIALDMDAKNVHCYKNGTLAGTISFSSFGTAWDEVYFSAGNYIASQVYNTNFGQRAFSHLPTGYKALNTANLPEPTIKKGSDHFNTVLYTGNSGTNAITGVGFSPDFTWISCRSDARSRTLVDSVRGFNGSSGRVLQSESSAVEWESAYFNSLDSDGFTVSGSENYINNSSHTYQSWNWKASDSAAAANTDGTINSTVSVNTTAGFSIGTFTGTGSNGTIGHGLGVAPKFILIKNRDSANSWAVYHHTIGADIQLLFNSTNATTADTTGFTEVPTSTVINVGSGAAMDTNKTGPHVFYAFSEVEGYSKFGKYTGNGSDNGPMVYTGFKPAFVLYKRTDASGKPWYANDSKRDPNNVVEHTTPTSNTDAEQTSSNNKIDFLSNGFKIRKGASSTLNASGGNFIYMAFAERPFKYANAR